jgi:hypothetical protein
MDNRVSWDFKEPQVLLVLLDLRDSWDIQVVQVLKEL